MDICRRIKVNVIVSEIASGRDDLNVKEKAVKECLQEMDNSKNAWFLDNMNIIPRMHPNRSKLHLNQKGGNIYKKF